MRRPTDWYFATGMLSAGLSIAASIATWNSPPGWFAPASAAIALAAFGLAAWTYRR